MWFLLNLPPTSDWLLYQQGLIMLICWQQICTFQLLIFWYKLPQFLGSKPKCFPQFFSNDVSNKVTFFLWIPPRVSWLWDLLFWKCIIFFVLHGGFLSFCFSLVTFPRNLVQIFRSDRSTYSWTIFFHSFYTFEIMTHFVADESFLNKYLATLFGYNTWDLNTVAFFSVEDF